MTLTLVLDVVLAVLLAATLVYAVVLNRRLVALRDARAEMQGLMASLAASTEQAGSGLESLKVHAEQQGERLRRAADGAKGLADDLAFLVERGTALADRLDGALGAARVAGDLIGPQKAAEATAPQRATARAAPGKLAAAGPAEPAASPHQEKLLKALQGMR
jgi:hypothetical protein